MKLSENPQLPEGFETKVKNLQFMKEQVPDSFQSAVNDIKNIAKGNDPEGLADQFYPGWEKADFEELLLEVGEQL